MYKGEYWMNTQNEARNLSMVMDLYELTMSNGYFEGAPPPVPAGRIQIRQIHKGENGPGPAMRWWRTCQS